MQQFLAALCQVLDSIGYDIAFVLSA